MVQGFGSARIAPRGEIIEQEAEREDVERAGHEAHAQREEDKRRLDLQSISGCVSGLGCGSSATSCPAPRRS